MNNDLISRSALKKAFYNQECWNVVIAHIIDNAPTIEPKKGKWENYNAYFKRCSLCQKIVGFDYIEQDGEVFNFCPSCGARMEDKNET